MHYTYQKEDWPWVWAIRTPGILNNEQADEDNNNAMIRGRGYNRRAPVQILDHLFIGSRECVKEIRTLQKYGITHILNMTGPNSFVPVKAIHKAGIQYLEIEAQDAEDYPLLKLHWDEAKSFLEQARKAKGGKCLVHCGAGLNRSGLIVAAEAMLWQQRSVLEVVRDLRRARGTSALSTEYFQEQLVALARCHDLLGPPPGEKDSIVKLKPPKQKSYQTL